MTNQANNDWPKYPSQPLYEAQYFTKKKASDLMIQEKYFQATNCTELCSKSCYKLKKIGLHSTHPEKVKVCGSTVNSWHSHVSVYEGTSPKLPLHMICKQIFCPSNVTECDSLQAFKNELRNYLFDFYFY